MHTSKGQPVRTVAYYRMSTDKQEDSIDRQKSQVVPHAAKSGYKIIRSYVDEGIGGDESTKRKGFMQMLADAVRGDFDLILCDDISRFGRFDSIDFGFFVKPLRDAGIILETVAEGREDWDSFAGRVVASVKTEAKQQENRDTSRRVLTQFLNLAKEGKYLGGRAPYGYRLADVPGVGKGLVFGPAAELAAVRLMFELCAAGDSLESIVNELNRQGFPPPIPPACRKNPSSIWCKSTVAIMLKNRKYLGDTPWNVHQNSKYHSFTQGEIQKKFRRIRQKRNAPEDWIIKPDTHEAIIDRDLFEKAQVQLKINRRRTCPHQGERNQFALSGLLVCGRCGYSYQGFTDRGRKVYQCGGYHEYGRALCISGKASEEFFLAGIIGRLQSAFLDPANLERLRQEMRSAHSEGSSFGQRQASIKARLAELDGKISQGMARMAIIPEDLLTEYAATVRGWKEDRERLVKGMEEERELQAAMNPEKVLELAESYLWRLEEAIKKSNPRVVREALRGLIQRVELHFAPVPKAKVVRSRWIRGIIHVKAIEGLDLSRLVSDHPSCINGTADTPLVVRRPRKCPRLLPKS